MEEKIVSAGTKRGETDKRLDRLCIALALLVNQLRDSADGKILEIPEEVLDRIEKLILKGKD